MGNGISRILFDHRDYELLGIVNDVLNRKTSFLYLKNLLYPYMHPRGIKEMAASRGLRMAYAAVHLLESLEVGKALDRLTALRCLRDEVMCSGSGPMQNNTARVLLVIMKELVRTRDDKLRQLQLAHEFCNATSGKPRIIRALLRRYHLLEMPEEWNQVTFDDHVHDVNTKGRKSPSHLIMDAWIKGIRRLTIIYYNHVGSKAAEELLEAAEIMGIEVRIGVEFWARFRGRYIQLIWVPRGFYDARDFLSFLADPTISSFLDEGRKASEYQQRYVMAVLKEFNERHLSEINEGFGLDLPILDETAFFSFVGAGQASILHLAEFIHLKLVPAFQQKVADLRERYKEANPEERKEMERLVDQMKSLDSEAIVELYLRPAKNPNITDPHVSRDDPGIPDLLRLAPSELVDRLDQLHSGYRITLNLSKLKVEDVLELLYDCKGAISHLEIFNLKDYVTGKSSDYHEISLLVRSINQGNVIALKKHIREIIHRMEAAGETDTTERVGKFKEILCNIGAMQAYYREVPLKTRIGSDSTGRSRRLHGMGLAIKNTLPHRAQKELEGNGSATRLTIPVRTDAYLRTTYIPHEKSNSSGGSFYRLLSSMPGLRLVGLETKEDWVVQDSSTRIVDKGNIISLGGIHEEPANGLNLQESPHEAPRIKISWKHLNGVWKNALKVLIGFIPAFTTFYLTKDWWFLAYLGAFIWFGITGLRNILQSVLGAGGIRRSPLVKWDSYVSWDRLTDSLLYTGFSVPLLEYLVKTVILDRSLGINMATHPMLLYTCIAAANGLYIFSHNVWRGLPKAAAVGNLFRTVLSIPLAIVLSTGIEAILEGFNVVDIPGVLQKWAAIISKTASDCVAGVIEGLADRYNNVRNRSQDYAVKLGQLFDTYAQMELIFPEVDVLQMLDSPKNLLRKISAEARDLERIIILNALDLLYFWMYQPRAPSVFCSLLKTMSDEERQILVRSQSVLRRKREVSQLFVNGIVGKKFAEALSFYLNRSDEYLDAIEHIANTQCREDRTVRWPIRFRKHCEVALGSLKAWSPGKNA